MNFDPIICDKKTTKKGFRNSIGWNLGKIVKSNHLLDPFISTPKNGINIKDIKNKIKTNIDIL